MASKELAAPDRRPAPIDVRRLRQDFPLLERRVNGRPLVYLDNTATTQKPRQVLDALHRFYTEQCANVHRGVHRLSVEATDAFEGARTQIQQFVGASDASEIVLTRGTTESINLVARSFGDQRVGRDDEILVSEMEHHSNIVPWQLLCERVGARLRVVPIDDSGELRMDEFDRLVGPRTRLISVAHVSNVLGTRNPVERIIELAHARGVPVLLDGAQGIVHEALNLARLDCDFYAFSGHKIYGPTGIGVLYGKAEHLRSMPPFQGGGDMIRSVTFERTTYNDPPHKFEAGTPDIAGAIGLGAALAYLSALGMDRVLEAEQKLLRHAVLALEAVPGLTLYGPAGNRCGVLSFNLGSIHAHDVGTVLDDQGIAVRAGHHCAQPLMDRLGVAATVRASLACYTLPEEIDALVLGLEKAIEVFA